jgi:hypothetical protein
MKKNLLKINSWIKPWLSLIVFWMSAAALAESTSATFATFERNPEFKIHEAIVKYRSGTVRVSETMNTFYNSYGIESVKYFSERMSDFEIVKFQTHLDTLDAIRALNSDPLVEYAQPNIILRIPRKPERISSVAVFDEPKVQYPCFIPGLPFPPGCDSSGSKPNGKPKPIEPPFLPSPPIADPALMNTWGLANSKATDAWQVYRGEKNIIVANIDTGVDYNHEDLAANMWRNPNPTKGDVMGWDFIHNDGLPYDDQGHGTHTAGTIGAVGGNGVAISGVIQKVSIMPIKFLSAEGSGTTEDAIKAIDYAVEHGAKILSNSWGGSGDDDNKALYDSIERARANDVLFIAAAGNSGQDNDIESRADYPAAFDNDNLISVAAMNQNDGMAYFSNYGRISTDLGAPGVNVYSTSPANRYAYHDGTSMACPHVAGAAALIWSRHPDWNYQQVKEALLKSVDSVEALSGRTVTGGKLNVLKALKMVE